MPEPIDRIVGFLRDVGLGIDEGPVPDDAFLPGVRIASGRIVFERARLQWPGDLLHEAGHLATTPASHRAKLCDDLAAHEEHPYGGEVEATAWAYAAIVALELDPALLFHSGGYQGRSPSLIATFSLGVFPGCQGLSKAGMTVIGEVARERGVPPYPHMLLWLRG